MTPSDAQAEALRQIIAWYRGGDRTPQEFYLAGFAGSGKTSIFKFVRAELLASGAKNILTRAFTGKASLVLRNKGIDDAGTLHSALYAVREDPETGRPVFSLDRMGAMLDADLLALDEVSMVNTDLANDARSFGKKILVMGDPGQLPPVSGAGAFTNREPDFFLTEIHRQAADSPIIRLATMARLGEDIPVGDYGDGVRVLRLDGRTHELAYREDTQTICGTHKVRYKVTQRIRQLRGYAGMAPRAGERIMCVRNVRELGLFNGMLGTMRKDARVNGDDGNFVFDVDMEDLELPLKKLPVHQYHFAQHFTQYERPRIHRGYHEFDWGNALTCHKAQGSEFPHVTLIGDGGSFGPDRDKWNYTGLTRASQGLTYLKRAA